MTAVEGMIALFIAVGVPCVTIIVVAWLFVKGMSDKDKK